MILKYKRKIQIKKKDTFHIMMKIERLCIFNVSNEEQKNLSLFYFDEANDDRKILNDEEKVCEQELESKNIDFNREDSLEESSSTENEDSSDDGFLNKKNDDQIGLEKVNKSTCIDEIILKRGHLNLRTPFLFFKSSSLPDDRFFCIHKSMFSDSAQLNDPLKALKQISSGSIGQKNSALFMISGGHFAGCIVKNEISSLALKNAKRSELEQCVKIVISKTFHRYTTRRKQGGAQSTHDNSKSKANSSGSALRRQNEQELNKDIKNLLIEWKDYLRDCHLIFLKSSLRNRKIFFFNSEVLDKNDSRLRTFKFTTKRPTLSELRHAWIELCLFKTSERPIFFQKNEEIDSTKNEKHTKVDNMEPKIQKQMGIKEINDEHSVVLINLINKQKSSKLRKYLIDNKLSANEFRFTHDSKFSHYPTILHYASSFGLRYMVFSLIKDFDCDPTVTNINGKTPYEISQNIQTRNTFRMARFELGEEFCNWKQSRIGDPKSREEFDQEEQEQQERLNAKLNELILKENEDKSNCEKPANRIVESRFKIEDLELLSLDQRRRVERELRARAAEKRFKLMQNQ